MEIKILKDEKNVLDVEIGNVTIVELLRVYLNENGAKMAVWKRDHPSKNPVLHIEADDPKKILKEAISQINSEIDNAVSEVKKIK
jgi:DNA-directed RNA polymerase subunit L